VWVTTISTAPAQGVFTPYFRYAFGVGVVAVLFPILILIGTATRLAAARREERFAAIRLVGGTPRDIGVFASVEAVVSAFCGAVLGIIVFLLVKPALAGAVVVGTKYFPATLTPTVWGYIAMLAGVPATAALAALVSLRRVQISPLGVSRRTSPPAPSRWRLAPLGAGVILYVAGLALTNHNSIGTAAYPGLLIILIGLVIAGPWLTAASARLLARSTRGPAPLLATRRLTDNPKAAARAVTGLVLAVFLGTMAGTLLPAVGSLSSTPNAAALSNVMLDNVNLLPAQGAQLLTELHQFPDTAVYPLYAQDTTGPGTATVGPGYTNAVMSCASLRALAVLGQCAPGISTVKVFDLPLITSDNPQRSTEAFVSADNPAFTGKVSALDLQAVLIRANDPATREQIRTFLATHTTPQTVPGPGQAPTPPRTFGETLAIRTNRAATTEKIVYAAVALTVLVAGCSLAVAIGGGLVERKRPFTLLRVSGTPVSTLSKVALLEAALPLAAATMVAAAIAYGTSVLAVSRLAPVGTAVPRLGESYYTTMGAGLAVALAVIGATLPLLRRMTMPGNVRFE
jgi:hypothetical protein